MILYKSWTSEAAVRVKPSLVEVKWFSRLLKKYFGLAGAARWGFPSHVVMWPCCLFEITTLFMHIFCLPQVLLGSSLVATTAAASTHIKKNKQRSANPGIQKRGVRERWGLLAARFCQYKTSTVLCSPLQRQCANTILIYAQWTLMSKCWILSSAPSESVYGYLFSHGVYLFYIF